MNGIRRVLAVVGLTPQDVKYALRSWVFGFLGLFIPGALGWLNELTKWAPGRPFPDYQILAAAAVAAVAGASVALLTLIWRAVEGKTQKGFLRPNPPKPRT